MAQKSFNWPRIWSRIVAVFVLLLVLNISSCSTSAFFFAPSKELAYYPDTTAYRVEVVNFKASDGKLLNGWFLKPMSGPVKATVIHLHGNGGNISYQYQFAEPLVKDGFQVFVFDYEGYGLSEGKASQEKVLDDARCALHYCIGRADVKETKHILFGQSLGAHLACVVAALENQYIDALIVEAPFSGHKEIAAYLGKKMYHLPKFLAYWLVPSKYDAYKSISQVTVPKLFIHSTEDQVCPYFMGQQLYQLAGGTKYFWEVKGPHIQSGMLYPKDFVAHFEQMIQ